MTDDVKGGDAEDQWRR